MFFPPIPLIRCHVILRALTESGAASPETAVTLAGAGIVNPSGFPRITRRMVSMGLIAQTGDGRYYLPR